MAMTLHGLCMTGTLIGSGWIPGDGAFCDALTEVRIWIYRLRRRATAHVVEPHRWLAERLSVTVCILVESRIGCVDRMSNLPSCGTAEPVGAAALTNAFAAATHAFENHFQSEIWFLRDEDLVARLKTAHLGTFRRHEIGDFADTE
jgi:hypothetical protein